MWMRHWSYLSPIQNVGLFLFCFVLTSSWSSFTCNHKFQPVFRGLCFQRPFHFQGFCFTAYICHGYVPSVASLGFEWWSVSSILFFDMFNRTRSISVQLSGESRSSLKIWWGDFIESSFSAISPVHSSSLEFLFSFLLPENWGIITVISSSAIALTSGTEQQKDRKGKNKSSKSWSHPSAITTLEFWPGQFIISISCSHHHGIA